MKISVLQVLFYLSLFLLMSQAVAQSEEEWLKSIDASTSKADIVKLKVGSAEVLALYIAAQKKPVSGGVIILHGHGTHPDWPQVIQPLRAGLAKRGWATLSIQMPVKPNETPIEKYVDSFDESSARIKAGIDYLNAQKIRNLTIIGYELGATMAAYGLVKIPSHGISAYVGISMFATRDNKTLDASNALALAKIPVLDIIAENDRDDILGATLERVFLAYEHRGSTKAEKNFKPQNLKETRYRRLEIAGADHSYAGFEEQLLIRIHAWLKTFAPSKIVSEK